MGAACVSWLDLQEQYAQFKESWTSPHIKETSDTCRRRIEKKFKNSKLPKVFSEMGEIR